MIKMSDIKPGIEIIFKKDFDNYYVLKSDYGWAVTTVPCGTKGRVKEIWHNSIIIELDENNSRTIWTNDIKRENDEIDFLDKTN
ncbi:MAG: hypothetical protein HY934_10290 [Candidatus Firestonebacteria bacterium]|nr:hypothetical protein [Candidatus Firestonebacteria bacterium]